MASTDDAETNTAFARKNGASFPILSDPDKRVAAAYGVLGANGFASRWTFYIDPEGRIALIDKDVNPVSAGTDMLKNFNRLEVPPR